MHMEQFLDALKEVLPKALEEDFGEGCRFRIEKINKINREGLTCLCIAEKDSRISPTIYLEGYSRRYQTGEPLALIVKDILAEYREHRLSITPSIEDLTDWETAKKKVFCTLVHQKTNEELLKNVPFRPFFNLAILCYLEVSDPIIGQGTVTIQKKQLELWKIQEEELFEVAEQNTREQKGCQIFSLRGIIHQMIQERLRELTQTESLEDTAGELETLAEDLMDAIENVTEEEIYLMTNDRQYFGAVTMIFEDNLYRFSCQFPKARGFFVIPGSIHEILLIPDEPERYFKEMVQEYLANVNREISKEDPFSFLSEEVYYYDKIQRRLIWKNEEEE